MWNQGPVMLRWLVFAVIGLSVMVIIGVGYILVAGKTVPERGNAEGDFPGQQAVSQVASKGSGGSGVRKNEWKKHSGGTENPQINKVGGAGGGRQRQIGEKPPKYLSIPKPRYPATPSSHSLIPLDPVNDRDRSRAEFGTTENPPVPPTGRKQEVHKSGRGKKEGGSLSTEPGENTGNQDLGLLEMGLGDSSQKQEFFCDLARQIREDCEALPRSPEALEFCLKANGYYTNSRHCGYRP